MLDYLKQQNVLNGFSVAEIPLTQAQNEIQKENPILPVGYIRPLMSLLVGCMKLSVRLHVGFLNRRIVNNWLVLLFSEKPSSDKTHCSECEL